MARRLRPPYSRLPELESAIDGCLDGNFEARIVPDTERRRRSCGLDAAVNHAFDRLANRREHRGEDQRADDRGGVRHIPGGGDEQSLEQRHRGCIEAGDDADQWDIDERPVDERVDLVVSAAFSQHIQETHEHMRQDP